MVTDMHVLLQSLLERAKQRGCSDDDILRVATSQGDNLLDKFADVMAEAASRRRDIFPVAVNYDLPVEEAIQAGGYQAVHAGIASKNFPSTKKGQAEVEIVLVRFDRRMASEEVVRELAEEGLRAAELPRPEAWRLCWPPVRAERGWAPDWRRVRRR